MHELTKTNPFSSSASVWLNVFVRKSFELPCWMHSTLTQSSGFDRNISLKLRWGPLREHSLSALRLPSPANFFLQLTTIARVGQLMHCTCCYVQRASHTRFTIRLHVRTVSSKSLDTARYKYKLPRYLASHRIFKIFEDLIQIHRNKQNQLDNLRITSI